MWFEYIDDGRTVADEAAFERTRTGLCIGPSPAAALEIATEDNVDRTAVVLLCDNGDRYFDVLKGS